MLPIDLKSKKKGKISAGPVKSTVPPNFDKPKNMCESGWASSEDTIPTLFPITHYKIS